MGVIHVVISLCNMSNTIVLRERVEALAKLIATYRDRDESIPPELLTDYMCAHQLLMHAESD